MFTVDVEKVYEGEYWTNRYLLEIVSLSEGVSIGQTIADLERTIMGTWVLQTKFRVSDGTPGTDVYQIVQLNRACTGGVTEADHLPLFNVLRVDFNAIGGGRPSRKYLRGVLGEVSITGDDIQGSLITSTMTNYVTPLLAISQFCDPDGQNFSNGVIWPKVAMRQLRRGSRRKTTPIIPA